MGDLNHAVVDERRQRFPDGDSADAERVPQAAFRREALTRAPLARGDPVGDDGADLIGSPAGSDREGE
jgi:hypothetical protein